LKKLESTLSATLTSLRELAHWQFLQKRGDSRAERFCDTFHVINRYVSFASLNTPDIIPMQAGRLREVFLGESLRQTPTPDVLRECSSSAMMHVPFFVFAMRASLYTL
jgi:hypothetical protein